MSTHLWLPDVHAHPKYDNERLTWAARLAVDYQVDKVVCVGDWADMPSLSSYDRGKRSFEGRRYKADIKAATAALEAFEEPFEEYNRGKSGALFYQPEMHMLLGNHEARINTMTQDFPELDGVISTSDIPFEDYGWFVHEFGKTVVVDGVAFCHYFASGVMGRPIGGEHIGQTLLNKLYTSAVQGHSHMLNYSTRTRPDGRRIHGMSIGSFVHPKFVEPWCAKSRHMWWSGVVVAKGVNDGDYTFELVSYDELRRRYG